LIDCTKSIYDEITKLSTFLNLKFLLTDDESIRINLILKKLSGKKDTLLIFDNIEEKDLKIIKDLVPNLNCYVIATCRDKHVAAKLGFKPFELKKLVSDESLLILSKYIECKRLYHDKNSTLQLCKKLDNLPLALNVVGSYLEIEKTISISQYLDEFSGRRNIPVIDDELNACFQISWQKINLKAKKVLLLMCQFSSSNINKEVAIKLAEKANITLDGINESIDELVRYYLVNCNVNGDYYIHNLIKRWCELKIRKEQEYNNIKVIFKNFLVDKAMEIINKIDKKDFYLQLYLIDDNMEDYNIVVSEEYNIKEKESTIIYEVLGKYFEVKGNYLKSINFYEKQLNASKELYPKISTEVARAYNNLGTSLGYQGKIDKSLEYHTIALLIRRKILGINHKDTASSYNNVGYIYYLSGKYRKAIRYYKKSIQIRKIVLGDKHIDTAESLMNLGQVYDTLGKRDISLEFYKKVFYIYKETIGLNNIEVGNLYNNIGGVYLFDYKYKRKDECLEKALENFNKALDLKWEVFGDKHVSMAITLDNISEIYFLKRKYKKSLENKLKALDIFIDNLGEQHVDTAICYRGIAGVYCLSEDYKNADKYYKITEKILRGTVGEKHLEFGRLYEDLGAYNIKLKKYSEAIGYFKEALKIHIKALGIINRDSINILLLILHCRRLIKEK
jgi:tetratricopeptide (TPR) repeat protein